MATYTVKSNQNIFDVAMSIYGTIEGLFDLLITNPEISMASELRYGQTLSYHSEYVLNSSIVESFASNKIIPTNGERHTYFKTPEEPLLIVFAPKPEFTYVGFKAAGEGTMIVDWGDNSQLESIILGGNSVKVEHEFDNETDKRRVRVYGNNETLSFTALDTTEMSSAMLLCRPLTVDEFVCRAHIYSLTGMALLKDTYKVDLKSSLVSDLTPIGDLELQELNLEDVYFERIDVLDDYLEYIVRHYNDRRPCTVYLSTEPSSRGLFAINTILNEPEWNVSDTWKFYINNELYIPQNGTDTE